MKLAGLTLAVLALLVPLSASATLELSMGFEPTEACPGDEVGFFFMLENVGDQEETVAFSVELAFDDMTWGPFEGSFQLPAGEVLSKEFAFVVPMAITPGTLTLTASAEDSGGMVSEVAELEILDCGGRGQGRPQALINVIRKELSKIGLGQQSDLR